MKLRFYDWFVFVLLAAIGFGSGSYTVGLLAFIAGLLYLVVRRNVFAGKAAPNISPNIVSSTEADDEFLVESSEHDGLTSHADIVVDVDINYRPTPGHFRLYSQFDLAIGKSEYEYKIEGTSVSIRLLNDCDEGESSHFKEEWSVRDGVVLESDIRARWETREFLFQSINEKIAALKRQTEWQAITPSMFNGFSYYLLSRNLPGPDARRYLRGEMERLKLGNACAVQEIAKYGLEPDPNPNSIDGWRWIGGQKPEGTDPEPFWELAEAGKFGIAREEIGRSGQNLIEGLQRLLGDIIDCSKCGNACPKTDKFCVSCGQRLSLSQKLSAPRVS